MPELCYYGCGTADDLRPYGPGGSLICFACMKADPERERQAASNFIALLEASESISPVGVAILDPDGKGPEPFLGLPDGVE